MGERRKSSVPAQVAKNYGYPTTLSEEEQERLSLWLTSIKLPQYLEIFITNNVGRAALPLLKEHHLKEMGIQKVGHRVTILQEVRVVQEQLATEERRAATVPKFKSWALCSMFTCWWKSYTVTRTGIQIETPYPTTCDTATDFVNIGDIEDINQSYGCCFHHVEVLSKDSNHPRLKIRLSYTKGDYVYEAIDRNWEIDQEITGIGGRTAASPSVVVQM